MIAMQKADIDIMVFDNAKTGAIDRVPRPGWNIGLFHGRYGRTSVGYQKGLVNTHALSGMVDAPCVPVDDLFLRQIITDDHPRMAVDTPKHRDPEVDVGDDESPEPLEKPMVFTQREQQSGVDPLLPFVVFGVYFFGIRKIGISG